MKKYYLRYLRYLVPTESKVGTFGTLYEGNMGDKTTTHKRPWPVHLHQRVQTIF